MDCRHAFDVGIGDKHIVQPWYQFLAQGDFNHGDELSFYYRPRDKIWEIVTRRQKNWADNDSDWILICIFWVLKQYFVNLDVEQLFKFKYSAF